MNIQHLIALALGVALVVSIGVLVTQELLTEKYADLATGMVLGGGTVGGAWAATTKRTQP